MRNDPYSILGVSRDASNREVRAAYRQRKKQYRAPRFGQKDLRILARERQTQIDDAYRRIRRQRRGEEEPTPREWSASTGDLGAQVRQLLEEGLLNDADALLRGAAVSERNAEWYFLMGQIQAQRLCFLDALYLMNVAIRIEPNTAEYREARQALEQDLKARGISYKQDRREAFGECCCECVGEIGCECCCEVCDGPC